MTPNLHCFSALCYKVLRTNDFSLHDGSQRGTVMSMILHIV